MEFVDIRPKSNLLKLDNDQVYQIFAFSLKSLLIFEILFYKPVLFCDKEHNNIDEELLTPVDEELLTPGIQLVGLLAS